MNKLFNLQLLELPFGAFSILVLPNYRIFATIRYSAPTGMAISELSNLSSIPPCPGIITPESLML